ANPLAPQAPGYLPGAPAAAPASASSGISAQGLLADLQKFEGFAVMVAGALLFIIASFLPWLASEGTNGFGGSAEDSVNAWDGDQPWMILGWDVSVQSLSSGDTSGTTDMLILLPIALVAVGAAAAPKLGKQFAKSREVATGAGVLLGVLTVAEVFSLSSSIDDFNSILSQNGFAIEASLSAGAWIGAIAAVVVAVGAVRLYMAEKQSP
ncbi:MAG TPA: hypothetical protein DCR14_08785, partial [Acidimicrobiaceae bacterium]|nr:hypothetical protein [Acidimicrobiaceae bacterium]